MSEIDGFQQALEALQSLDEKTRSRILADIAKKNPTMAARLNESLFSFADLQFLLPSDFKIVWWDLPRKAWLVALRQPPPTVWKMLERNLARRAFEELKGQVADLGPQPVSKVAAAQKEICDGVRELIASGKMAAPGGNENDPLV